MSCGFFALLVVHEGDVPLALWLVFAAALCDVADGRLARKLSAETPFGAELDSFADSISFGVAPAIILYETSLSALGVAGGFLAFFYASMAVFRLVRFNLETGKRGGAAFRGFSTPMAALYVLSFVVMRGSLPSWLGPLYAVSLGWLMMSSIPSPTFKGGGLSLGHLGVALVNTVLLLLFPGFVTFAWWNLFNLFLLVLVARKTAPPPPSGAA
jgi:CDP-diacylglycerol--serine O-phosphatidyltransferase